jgi:3-hydroxyacyl-CoA dehydrogenase/enoyl-CoA hydratase/3-hydroxybutyryl-CoA epimerase
MARTATQGDTEEVPVRMEVEDGVAVIRLNQPGRPVNVLNAALLREMETVLDRLEGRERGARAAVLISDKPGVWIAGADIEEFTRLDTAADAERLSATGQQLLGRLERLPIPVVAAIHGAALGGGLETALACTYRIATDDPKTKLGLPEVQLGILPGAGGTQRLPRLLGIRAALDLMLTGKQLDAGRARKLGLVDEVVPAPVLLEVAKRVARELADGTRTPRAARPKGSPQWVENLPGLRAFLFRKARQGVLDKTRGLYPAPLRILEVVENGLDRSLDRGLEMEARAFGELAVTPESRSLVHLFFATTAAKNEPGLAAGAETQDLDRIAVVGAGFMGAGIAAVSAEAGMRVRLKDVTPEAVAKGLGTARGILVKRASRKRRRPFEVTQLTDRVEATHEYTGFGTVDLVVEAVFEDVDLKHSVIREMEAVLPPDAILGSNTSTIPIARLAEASERPEKLIGLHFFSPVEKMPLLEIIATDRTSPETIASSHRYGKKLGKTPIIVGDQPGFYVNRILTPYMNEAALLLQEGVGMGEIDRALLDWGFPVGPIALYDEVGIDVAGKAGGIMTEAFGDRIHPNAVVPKMVEDGRLGRKNRRGFYRYDEEGKKAGPDETVYALIGATERRAVPRKQIQERLTLLMIGEAVRCLEDGVLHSARDGDVGAVLGIGFPPFRGGPFWYLDTAGPAAVLERLRALEAEHGPRFAPAPLLVQKAEGSGRFFINAQGDAA